ncbi:hypothetical protein DAI22_07g193000 [Oryza sativa Japonica Group]|nr:hypothetical protein DAI22_07g193000 [Oryza sativa Japonica Group]
MDFRWVETRGGEEPEMGVVVGMPLLPSPSSSSSSSSWSPSRLSPASELHAIIPQSYSNQHPSSPPGTARSRTRHGHVRATLDAAAGPPPHPRAPDQVPTPHTAPLPHRTAPKKPFPSNRLAVAAATSPCRLAPTRPSVHRAVSPRLLT